MEGGIGVAFSIGLDETTMAIPSNCLNKTRQTSHPGNGVPYPLCSTEPPPLWAGVPADIALNRRVPAQGILWHALRGEETHFKGQKERGFSFPPHFSFLCPVSYFYPIQKGLSEEDCCCRLKWCLTQEHNLDTQFDVLSIFFQKYCFWEVIHFNYFPKSSLETPISKATFSPFCLGRKVEVCNKFHVSCNSNHKIHCSFTSHTWPLKCNHMSYTNVGSS